MATLKLKKHTELLVRNIKTFKICNLIFRVPKKSISGLPYLPMGWGKDINFCVFMTSRALKFSYHYQF